MLVHNNQALKGGKILLICPRFFGYEKSICDELEACGASVWVINADPSGILGTFISTLQRLHIKAAKIIRWFEHRILNQINSIKFDYVLVICGWAVTSYCVKKIRENHLNGSGRMVLYYWDSLDLLKDDISRWSFFDKIFTFDKNDYDAHKDLFDFLPLFYCNNYLDMDERHHKYHISTIGSYKYDRYFMIERLKNQNPRINIYSYLYTPKWMILFHKAFRRKYRNIDLKKLSFKKLTTSDIKYRYEESDAVLDIPRTGQNGLTMRTFECLAMKKKIVTTNANVVQYDFYNSNNIFVMDRDLLELPKREWFESPYSNLNEGIIEKYSITNWIERLLS